MKISKIFLTFSTAILFFFSNYAVGQTTPIVTATDTIEAPLEPEVIYPYEVNVVDERDKQNYRIIVESPEVVEQRLKSIQHQMPFEYNSSVKLWLDFFMVRRPSFTKKMMEEKDIYFPTFERYLAMNNMPDDLKYLAMLESGLNPKAVSRSKAVGLWQFMAPTGKDMGLSINSYLDERMDIEKSTDAACKYLKQLYNKFNDWELALASYNTGPNRIARVIQNTGLSSYWDLHPHIHPDTRAYVPQFIAIAYMMNYGNAHGIFAENPKQFIPSDKINTQNHVDLNVFASLSNISIDEIKQLNPQFKSMILPADYSTHTISLPSDKIAYFNQYKDFILDSASRRPYSTPAPVIVQTNDPQLASSGNSNITTLEDGTIVIGRRTSAPVVVKEEIEDDIAVYKSSVREVKKIHKVRRGEFLIKIANRYDVSTNEIKKWNHLKSSKVMYGTKLVIYVNEKVKTKTTLAKSKKQKKTESQEEQEPIVKTKKSKKELKKDAEEEQLAKKESKKSKTDNNKEDSKVKSIVHTVKPGDTLWNISQKYDGVTVDEIKKINRISGNTVKVGQKIKIKA